MQKKSPKKHPKISFYTMRSSHLAIVGFFVFCLFSNFVLKAQTGTMSEWYGSNGKKTDFSKVLNHCQDADVILFGELHNNAVSHWYQLQLFRGLYKQHPGKMKLGMEMLETHQQAAVDSFLKGLLKSESFLKSQNFWPNHKTDYHPLLEDAFKESIPVIATNVPRKYARIVSKMGMQALDTLSPEEKKLLSPLPYTVDTTLNCYKNLLSMGHGTQASGYQFASAQALKDATMAHFILKNLNQGEKFLHLNGAYHSDFFESIVWYLKKERPELKIVVLSTIESVGLKAPDATERKKGNYILVTDPDSPKSY
jgi:uncharacterized iron-regulated protein